METVSQEIFEHIYNVCPMLTYIQSLSNQEEGGRVIGNNKVGGFKFVVINCKSYFFARISRTFLISFFEIYVHLSYYYHEIGFGSKGLLVVYGLGYCLYYVVQFH